MYVECQDKLCEDKLLTKIILQERDIKMLNKKVVNIFNEHYANGVLIHEKNPKILRILYHYCDVLTLCIPRLSVPSDHVRIGIESFQRYIFSEL